MMMELGEEPAITDLVRKTHMKGDGSFVDKRAKKIVDEVESIVVSQQVSNTDHEEVGSQGSYSQTPITSLMRDEAFYSIVKPHKGRLFGLGTAQMENYDPIEPPATVLPRQARLERDVINLTEVVKLMGHQITALCEARGVTVPSTPETEQPTNPSQQPHSQTVNNSSTDPSPAPPPITNEQSI